MKKLIAQRLIRYQGRTYERGEALPAADALMTAAWLRAGSAAWAEPAAEQPAEISVPDEVPRQAAEALEALGVEIRDENGAFVGPDALMEQLRLLGQELVQDFEEVLSPAADGLADGALPGEELPEPKEGGRFALARLSRMTRAELEALAAEVGADVSECRTNAERAEILAGLVEDAPPETAT